jgi:hypothetical protein
VFSDIEQRPSLTGHAGRTMDSIIGKLTGLGLEPLEGEAFEPLSEDDISRLQTILGATLPESYTELLTTFGASMFSREINCTPQGEPLYFGWFYGLNDLVEALNTHQEVLPESVIPIGDDGGGNQFCLGVRGEDFDKVYFHNHSLGWRSDAATYLARGEPVPDDIQYQTVHEVAPSFEQFILNLAVEE